MVDGTPSLAPVDGCPGCVANVEPARTATRLFDAVRCSYKCSDCGFAWVTEWKD